MCCHLYVNSRVKVDNLNADLFDDEDSDFYTNATNLVSGIMHPDRLVGPYNNIQSVGTIVTSLNVQGDFSVDVNTFKVNSVLNRIGIGVVNPATELDVNGTVQATHFKGDGNLLTNLNGSEVKGVIAADIMDDKVTSQKIRNLTITDEDINLNASIAFKKLNITKKNLVEELHMPTADTHRTTTNVVKMVEGAGFLTSANNLSDLANVVTARDNLELGVNNSVTFNNLHLSNQLTVQNLISINGVISSNYFSGDGSRLTSINVYGDGSHIWGVFAEDITNNRITSQKIVDGTILNNDVSDNAAIDFRKLNISKRDLVIDLGIPTADTHRSTQNILDIVSFSKYLVTGNNLSEVTSTYDSRYNIGLGTTSNAIFDTVTANSWIHSVDGLFTGDVTANNFAGDGSRLTNVQGKDIIGVIAEDIVDNRITTKKVINGSIIDEDVSDNAAIAFRKLNITKRDLVVDLNIPTADTHRTTDNIVQIVSRDYLVSGNNLSDVVSTASARYNLGLGPTHNVTFNNLSITNMLRANDATFNGTVSASYFVGDGSYITNIDGRNIRGIRADYVTDNAVNSLHIRDGSIINSDVSDNAAIAFSKLDITKENLVVSLNIPTADTHRSTVNVIALLSNHYLSTNNNLSELTNTSNARQNIGLGHTSDVSFKSLLLTGGIVAATANFSGNVTANTFYGDGFNLTNLDGNKVSLVTATSVTDNTVTGIKIVDGTIHDPDVSPTAAIAFSKLNITKADIVGLGIPTANRTTANIISMVSNQFLVSGNNLSDLNDFPTARNNLGLGTASHVTFNILSFAGRITAQNGNFSGDVTANRFWGDGSGLTNLPTNNISTVNLALNVADDSITSSKILDGTIVDADVAAGANIAFSKLNIQASDISGLLSGQYLLKSNNLSDLSNKVFARNNLELGIGDTVQFKELKVSDKIEVDQLTITSNSAAAALYLKSNTNSPIIELERVINQPSGIIYTKPSSNDYWFVGVPQTSHSFQVGYSNSINNATQSSNSNIFIDKNNGYVGINTDNPQSILHVDGTSEFQGDVTVKGHLLPSATNSYDLGSSSKRWRDIYSTNVLNTSDRRLKKDIKPLTYGLKDVLKLRPVSFVWKNNTSQKSLGFIAQEVQTVIPEVVRTAKDGYWSMNYTGLIPVIVKGVQEQQVLIEEQEKEILEFKTRIEELRNKLDRVLLNKD